MVTTAPSLTLPAALAAYIEDERRRADVAGAAVVAFDRDGLRSEQYFGYADLARGTRVGPETLFRAASISKMFTATLVLQEVDAGRVDLDAPVNQYLDTRAQVLDGQGAPDARVTARHLLMHMSGLPTSWRGLVYPNRLLNMTNNGLHTPRSLADVVAGMRTIRAPGERLVYANGGFALLGYLAARLSKAPFEDVVRDRVFGPLGMTASAFPVSATGARVSVPYGKALGGGGGRKAAPVGTNLTGPAGALVTSARDLACFGRMVLRGGELDGTRLISESLAAEATRRHATNHPGLSDGWGLGFQVSDYRERRMVGHSGDLPGVSTTIMMLPDDGIGVIVLTNGGDGAFTQRVRERVLEQMLGLEPEAVPGSPIGVTPERAAEWRGFTNRVLGRYRLVDLAPPGPLAFAMMRFLRPRIEHVSDDILAVGGLGADVAMLYPDGGPGHYRVAHPLANGSRAVIEERADGAHLWAFIVHAFKPA